MKPLLKKTLFITGASRGIGKAIALRAAQDGANIVLAAKTVIPHPQLPGTIYTAAEEIEKAGGTALPCMVDIRFEDQIQNAVDQAVKRFGGIDILVNNASALSLTSTLDTPLKKFDLMMQINVRGTFACAKACLPYLLQAPNPHILVMSPPLQLEPTWFAPHLAYTISKFGMSLCALGLAEEFRSQGIAVNALWPKTLITTSAIENLFGEEFLQKGRTPDIVADAAYAILSRQSRTCTGNFFVDEDVLRQEGITDFRKYAANPEADLLPDLFILK